MRDIERHKATMRAYYYAHKDKYKIYAKRYRNRNNNKKRHEFLEKRNKCIWYLKHIKGWSYKEIANRLSIYDPDSIWRMLKTYERTRNEKASQI